MKASVVFLIQILCFVLSLNTAKAQGIKAINDSIFSHELNEIRQIIILLPEEYTTGSDTEYAVIYLLDGENHFDDFSFIFGFAKDPEMVSNYYCSDPALYWNNNRIITMATEVFKNSNELDKTLWITGVESTYRNVGIARNDSI